MQWELALELGLSAGPQRTTYFAARVGFCAASFLNFDFPRDFAGCSSPVLSAASLCGSCSDFDCDGELNWLMKRANYLAEVNGLRRSSKAEAPKSSAARCVGH